MVSVPRLLGVQKGLDRSRSRMIIASGCGQTMAGSGGSPTSAATAAVSGRRGACRRCLLLHPDGLFAPRDATVTLHLNTAET